MCVQYVCKAFCWMFIISSMLLPECSAVAEASSGKISIFFEGK